MSEDVKTVDAASAAAPLPAEQPGALAAAPAQAAGPAKTVSKRTVVRAVKAKPAQPAKVPAKARAAAKVVKPKIAKTNTVAEKVAAKPAKPAKSVKSARIAAKPPVAKLAVAKPTARGSAKAPAEPVRATETVAQPQTAADPFAKLKSAAHLVAAQFKDKTMNQTTTTALLTDCADFAKGNLEAVVASGKILFAGLQSLGSSMAADSKAALETYKTDAKDLAGARTPTEFVQLQSDMFRRNWDTAVSCASKNSAAVMKLANDAVEPLAGRVNLAVDRVRNAA